MKKKYEFCLSVCAIFTAFLLAMSGVRKNEAALAARIAPEILRFHVLANSDSPEDQALKLEVKEFLLEEIREGVAGVVGESGTKRTGVKESCTKDSGTKNPIDRKTLVQYIMENKARLEQTAERFMVERGFDYSAEVRLESCEFPQKTYGDMTFPAGTYEAVRVVLGAGEGQNFWCVLYPSLCYIDSTYAVVPDSSKELLQTLIPEDDFQALLTTRRVVWSTDNKKTGQDSLLPRPKIRLKFAELFD